MADDCRRGVEGESAYEDSGELVPVSQFDWAAVERNLRRDLEAIQDPEELSKFTPEEREAALKLFRTLVRWLWQDGMKNTDGLTIRSIIVCWIFLEELHPLTLTQMARGFGKHKQSLGRWVDDFKKRFSFIRTPHQRWKE